MQSMQQQQQAEADNLVDMFAQMMMTTTAKSGRCKGYFRSSGNVYYQENDEGDKDAAEPSGYRC